MKVNFYPFLLARSSAPDSFGFSFFFTFIALVLGFFPHQAASQTYCRLVLAIAGEQNFSATSQDERKELDTFLRGACQKLRTPSLSDNEKKELHTTIYKRLFPIVLQTAFVLRPDSVREMPADDLISIVNDTMVKTIRSLEKPEGERGAYDLNRTNRVTTYAVAIFKREFDAYNQSQYYRNRPYPTDPHLLQKMLASPKIETELPLLSEIQTRLAALWNNCTYDTKKILYDLSRGKTVAALAREQKCSNQTIRNHLSKAVKEIKTKLKQTPIGEKSSTELPEDLKHLVDQFDNHTIIELVKLLDIPERNWLHVRESSRD